MAEMVLGFGPIILHDPFLWFNLNSHLFLPLALDFAKEEVTKKFMFVLKFPNNHWVKEWGGRWWDGGGVYKLKQILFFNPMGYSTFSDVTRWNFHSQDGAEDFKLWLPEDESFAQVMRQNHPAIQPWGRCISTEKIGWRSVA